MVNRRLNNIRNTYFHEITKELVKTKPVAFVIEDLCVSDMKKNAILSSFIQQQCFNKFRQILNYKSREYGISIIEADRFYPSSKMCSCCGNIKRHLSLKERIYKCDICGMELDRDFNASVNLKNLFYK